MKGLKDEEFLSLAEAALNRLVLGGHLFFSASFTQDSSKNLKISNHFQCFKERKFVVCSRCFDRLIDCKIIGLLIAVLMVVDIRFGSIENVSTEKLLKTRFQYV